MNILITGAKGQLGSELFAIIMRGSSEIGPVSPLLKSATVIGEDSKGLDITNVSAVKEYVRRVKPDIIMNPAAYTNVDDCELNPDHAFKVNALGARNLAIAAEDVGAKLIQISTDYVFDGEGNTPYREYDIPHPVSVYGKTKLLGERYVQDFCSRYFIVRTSWLYGYHGKNFVKTILKAAKEKGHLEVVDDQTGNPTNAADLAHHLLKIALDGTYGLYHCTGNGECNWYEFALKIVEYAGIQCSVVPIKSTKLERAAKRPSFSALDHVMLRSSVGDNMRNWQEALIVFIANINQ